jgi:hypothetical protein
LALQEAPSRVEPRRDYLQRERDPNDDDDEDDQDEEHEDLGDEPAIVREPDDDE